MQFLLGIVFVLGSWLLLWALVLALGLLPSALVTGSRQGWLVLRHATWWGLALFTITVMFASLVAALGSPSAALLVGSVTLLVGSAGVILVVRRGMAFTRPHWGWPRILVVLAVAMSAAYFALAALGPVTNYDSGLYHLGAIHYAFDSAAIPGLVNLYFPFGYGTAQFPLAAFLGNGMWGDEGYRLLNGFVLFLVAAELVLRLVCRPKGPGTYVLLAGVVSAWVPLVALSDYWVTSPSQDSASWALTVVASAYVVDAVAGGRRWVASSATALAISLVMVSIRPTSGAYLVGVLAIVALLVWRRRKVPRASLVNFSLVLVAGVALGVANVLRDRLLSGWVGYPLSLVAFDVPWLASDPTPARTATLGFHRNPDDLWNSTEGWDWVQPWIADRWNQWETYAFLTLVLVVIFLVAWRVVVGANRRLWLQIVASTAPSVFAVAAWWTVTPPSYRFAWGPLFTVVTVPIGWLLWSLVGSRASRAKRVLPTKAAVFTIAAAPILLVTVFSGVARFDWSAQWEDHQVLGNVAVPVASVVNVPVTEFITNSGLKLQVPVESDQCWENYPLCTPAPDPKLATLDRVTEQGFVLEP